MQFYSSYQRIRIILRDLIILRYSNLADSWYFTEKFQACSRFQQVYSTNSYTLLNGLRLWELQIISTSLYQVSCVQIFFKVV
jgi:hypothetical protein